MTNEHRNENYEIIEFNNLIVNNLEQVVSYKDVEIKLTNREFQILYFLMRHQGQVFSKTQIYNQVTGDVEKDSLHTIEITISRIRKKLEARIGRKDLIVTIRGRGYKFKK